MKKGKITLFIIVLIAVSALPLSLFAVVSAKPITQLPDYEPMKVGPEFRAVDLPISSEMPAVSGLRTSAIGDVKMWLSLDSYSGVYFFDNFVLMAESDNTEVWVQMDMSWPTGDPRLDPEVTVDQAEFLLDEFDEVIYPRDTEYFGVPDYHDGAYSLLEAWGYVPEGYYGDDDGRNVILISNIIDDSYYDPDYHAYIVGFYSPTFEAYFDRNIISIDCYNYTHRLGLGTPSDSHNRPYVYDGTIAHEYQHLIHDDKYPTDELYMNEACSLYAEPLCLADQPYYELDLGQVEWFMATPDNALTQWGDQGDVNILADYGSSFLWAVYLCEHYGSDFLSKFVQGNDLGLPMDTWERISEIIPGKKNFDDVYHDWRIANLLDSKIGCSKKYYYEMLDLHDLETPLKTYPVDDYPEDWIYGKDFGNTITHPTTTYPGGIELLDTDIMKPYSTDYIVFNEDNFNGFNTILFDGEDYSTVDSWVELDEDFWYSGTGDLYDRVVYGEVEVVGDDLNLYINTYYDLEDYWDFGFVQVSTDNGETWTSLANEWTTDIYDPSAHPDIIANLPGLTSYLLDWELMSFDLSAYEGQTVLVGFRFMTDWATHYEGWYLDGVWLGNPEMDGTPIDLQQWTQGPEVDFYVTVIEKFEKCGRVIYKVRDMRLKDDATEIGVKFAQLNKWEELIIIVSPMFTKGFCDYSFFVFPLFKKKCWR
jgi:hypothetical protein